MAADGIKLAPHYECLLATGAYCTRAFADDRATWANVPMAIALPGAKVFGDVTGASVLQAGLELGVPASAAQRILAEVVAQDAGRPRARDRQLPKRHAALPPVAGVHPGAEARLMRVLEQIMVPEMLARLRPTNP